MEQPRSAIVGFSPVLLTLAAVAPVGPSGESIEYVPPLVAPFIAATAHWAAGSCL